MKNLNEMTSKELKETAKELHVKNWWKLKKDDLIIEIEKIQNASDEEKKAMDEEKAREDAAVAEYTKNYRKYTERFNVSEFLEKWRSGEIVLESEEAAVEAVREEMEKNGIGPSEEDSDNKKSDLTAENPEPKEKSQDQPTETLKPKRGALIEYNGKSQNICAWADELGISANTLYGRLYKLGWSVEKAFTKK